MGLIDKVAAAFGGATARLRRDAIAYAVCAICAIMAIALITSASVLALEPQVGEVYARLIVAGVFVVIAAGVAIVLRQVHQQPRPAIPLGIHAEAQPSARSAQFAQLAMIVEAVLLGYSLSRRSDRR